MMVKQEKKFHSVFQPVWKCPCIVEIYMEILFLELAFFGNSQLISKPEVVIKSKKCEF